MELVVSCSAAARLDAARRWLASLPRDGEAIILAPHAHAAGELVRAEVSDTGSRFGIQRFTLDRLAARLALPHLAGRRKAAATSLTLVAVVTRAIHRLLESGQAGRFEPIAGRPGFPHAVLRTWQELRGAGFTGASLGSEDVEAKSLAAIVDRVEREMEEMELADRAEIFRVAREAIERDEPFTGAPVLLLDLPLEQKIEIDLAAALVSRAGRAMATAPAGDERCVLELTRILGAPARPLEDSAPSTSLAMLQCHLFEDSSPARRALDETVTLASWPGEARECVEIARRIQEEATTGM